MIKMNRNTAAIAVLLSLLVVGGVGTASSTEPKPQPPDYFPLRVGDWWKYKSTTADDKTSEFTVKVLNQEKQTDGAIFYLVETLTSFQPINDWYSKPTGWVVFQRQSYPKNPNLNVVFQPTRNYLKNPFKPGDSWSWQGQGMMGVEIQETSQVVGGESVVVPAGKFQAMKVVTQVTQGGTPVTKTYWYANRVGLVKSKTDTSTVKSTTELQDYSFNPKP
jgi:hypothetical protein